MNKFGGLCFMFCCLYAGITGHGGRQEVGPWICSPSSILRLHVLIHKISTIFILNFPLFGLVLILSAILTPLSPSLTQFKALQLFHTNCSKIPALKHLRSLTHLSIIDTPNVSLSHRFQNSYIYSCQWKLVILIVLWGWFCS